MQDFRDRIAVVTGGGTGMGRELARQLAAEGCHVAVCDVFEDSLAETEEHCRAASDGAIRVSTHVADVADVQQVETFRDAVASAHQTDHIHLLFNNAGVAGGGSFVLDDPQTWERTFAVCWGGVYNCTRTFLPMLLKSPEGHLVNTSSVNGFRATLGEGIPHTAYSTAKFAVKGFSESLIADFRQNAPHLRVSVVMPGHIGTSIVLNTQRYHGRDMAELTETEIAGVRQLIAGFGFDMRDASRQELADALQFLGETFRDTAPLSAAQAATIILDGVRAEKWRILVGEDAERLDREVREHPESAYDLESGQPLSS